MLVPQPVDFISRGVEGVQQAAHYGREASRTLVSDDTAQAEILIQRRQRLTLFRGVDRMVCPAVMHDINVLTVVASESYRDFVAGLQQEIAETLSSHPRQATEAYNPDWAISFRAGSVRHIYFVAESKGMMSSMKLREIEKTKIECARKFLAEISHRILRDCVKCDVVTNHSKLTDIVGRVA